MNGKCAPLGCSHIERLYKNNMHTYCTILNLTNKTRSKHAQRKPYIISNPHMILSYASINMRLYQQNMHEKNPKRALFTLGYTNVSVNSTETPVYTSRKIKHQKSHMTHQMTHHLDSNLRPSKHKHMS